MLLHAKNRLLALLGPCSLGLVRSALLTKVTGRCIEFVSMWGGSRTAEPKPKNPGHRAMMAEAKQQKGWTEPLNRKQGRKESAAEVSQANSEGESKLATDLHRF